MTHRTILLIAIFLLLVNDSAEASTAQSDLNLCRRTLSSVIQDKYAGAHLKTKSISGHSLRKISFRMRIEDERYTVVCMVKNGKITEVIWPDDRDRGTDDTSVPTETAPND